MLIAICILHISLDQAKIYIQNFLDPAFLTLNKKIKIPFCYDRPMAQKIFDYKVFLEKDPAGGYVVICPSFQGCYSQGETIEEALDNIKEAIELYLETISEDERKNYLSHEIYTTSVEVNVA